MSRRRGRAINGWLIVDKPVGITSNAALTRIKRTLNAAKAGHGGTLDPLASGVLPVALGEATKTVSFIMDGRKTYTFTAHWGEARDSDDADGDVVETSDIRPEAVDIEGRLADFTGLIEQTPPQVSAIKINGRRAYELVRNRQPVDIAPRPVMIERFELIDCPDRDHARFRAICGKGAYVRALVRDIARRLGTVGHVTELRRTRVGPFGEEQAISLDSLEGVGHSAPPEGGLLPVATVLDDIPALSVTRKQAVILRNGQSLVLSRIADYCAKFSSTGDADDDLDDESCRETDGVTVVTCEGDLVALARITEGRLQPVRVFHI